MYCILNKDMIEMDIVPIISRAKRGFRPTVSVSEIVIAVLYKLKTGFQWNQLPLRALFFGSPLAGNRSPTIIGNGVYPEPGRIAGPSSCAGTGSRCTLPA